MDCNAAVLEMWIDKTAEPLGQPPVRQGQRWAVPLLAVAGLVCTGPAGVRASRCW